jgi:hypothetical protein
MHRAVRFDDDDLRVDLRRDVVTAMSRFNRASKCVPWLCLSLALAAAPGCSSSPESPSGPTVAQDAAPSDAMGSPEATDANSPADAPNADSGPLGMPDNPVVDAALFADATEEPPPVHMPDSGGSCFATGGNCSLNSECCSGVCLWTGGGGQCVDKCTSSAECASGCCTEGSCAPDPIWCQSTFACWPLGHGCANDPSACCSGALCADIALSPNDQILVCSQRCSTNADCTSNCCVQFQSGDFLCDRSIACGGP